MFGRQDAKLLGSDNKFGYDPNDPAGDDDVIPGVNDITVPVNKPVVVKLTSLDVIHSFKLYNLRVNQDAIPGLMVPIHFVPTLPGKYQIVCAQLCGNGHAQMRGFFTVLEPDKYAEWLASQPKSKAAAISFE